MTIIYLATVTDHGPLPRKFRSVNYAVTAALVATFSYYAALRVINII